MPNAVEPMPQTESNAAAAAPAGVPSGSEGPAPRLRAKFVALALLFAALGTALYFYFHYRGQVSTDDATVDGHISAIAPKISGNVTDVLVLDNQPVKAGDVLVRIDPRDYQARVDQACALLEAAESQARGANAGVPLTSATTASGTSAASGAIRSRSACARSAVALLASTSALATASSDDDARS